MTQWRNRIVGYGTRRADQFLAHPENARTHPQKQRAAVRSSLNTLGWVAPVIVSARSGYTLDGHERVWQGLDNDNAEIPYVEVDLSENEERLFLAVYDYTTSLATFDRDLTASLLEELNTTVPEMQALLAELAESSGVIDRDEGDDEVPLEKEIQCPSCGHAWVPDKRNWTT
jgi:hypothetical protein